MTGRVPDSPVLRLLAEHRAGLVEAKVLLPAWAQVDEHAVRIAYERGLLSAPEGTDPDGWAEQRVKAFLATSLGHSLPGYVRDLDLLPDGHPAVLAAAADDRAGATLDP